MVGPAYRRALDPERRGQRGQARARSSARATCSAGSRRCSPPSRRPGVITHMPARPYPLGRDGRRRRRSGRAPSSGACEPRGHPRRALGHIVRTLWEKYVYLVAQSGDDRAHALPGRRAPRDARDAGDVPAGSSTRWSRSARPSGPAWPTDYGDQCMAILDALGANAYSSLHHDLVAWQADRAGGPPGPRRPARRAARRADAHASRRLRGAPAAPGRASAQRRPIRRRADPAAYTGANVSRAAALRISLPVSESLRRRGRVPRRWARASRSAFRGPSRTRSTPSTAEGGASLPRYVADHPAARRRPGRGADGLALRDGRRRAVGGARRPRRSLRAPPGHAARLLPRAPRRRSHVARLQRRLGVRQLAGFGSVMMAQDLAGLRRHARRDVGDRPVAHAVCAGAVSVSRPDRQAVQPRGGRRAPPRCRSSSACCPPRCRRTSAGWRWCAPTPWRRARSPTSAG